MSEIQDVLQYWFGDLSGPDDFPVERSAMWFTKDPATDYFIRQTFEPDVVEARAGGRDGWKQTPEGSLALMLLLDQLPRNMYRDMPAAFESDLAASILCLECEASGFDKQLWPVQRAFLYMCLQHAEDLEVQEKSVELFGALVDDAPPAHLERFENFYDFAVRHRDVIERFGRFPHRNEILGRESTPRELAFLETPGSRF